MTRSSSLSTLLTSFARVLEREALKDSDIKSVVEDRLKVLAEPGRLFRALANLVRNATRYAGEAGPIEIQARLENDDIVITVADSGPGVPEDTLEDLLGLPQNLWIKPSSIAA